MGFLSPEAMMMLETLVNNINPDAVLVQQADCVNCTQSNRITNTRN